MRPAPRGAASVAASLDRDATDDPAGDQFAVYQDSSGGANWQSPNHVNRDGRVPTVIPRIPCDGGRQRRSRVCERRRSRQSDTGDSRITIAAPPFWEAFPKALALDQETCAVGILPRQFSDSHELQGGERTTFAFVLAVGDDPVSDEPLAWARSPLIVSVDPDVYRAGGFVGSARGRARPRHNRSTRTWFMASLRATRHSAIAARSSTNMAGAISARSTPTMKPSSTCRPDLALQQSVRRHRRMASRFMQTGDARWWSAMCELAAHVTDIDLYHTTDDRAAYNGGYFWHTQHYATRAPRRIAPTRGSRYHPAAGRRPSTTTRPACCCITS